MFWLLFDEVTMDEVECPPVTPAAAEVDAEVTDATLAKPTVPRAAAAVGMLFTNGLRR